jgi:hypothetical protein
MPRREIGVVTSITRFRGGQKEPAQPAVVTKVPVDKLALLAAPWVELIWAIPISCAPLLLMWMTNQVFRFRTRRSPRSHRPSAGGACRRPADRGPALPPALEVLPDSLAGPELEGVRPHQPLVRAVGLLCLYPSTTPNRKMLPPHCEVAANRRRTTGHCFGVYSHSTRQHSSAA